MLGFGIGLFLIHNKKTRTFRFGLSIWYLAVSYSHMGKPHTTIGRYCVSLLSSAWSQVGPQCYGRQAITCFALALSA